MQRLVQRIRSLCTIGVILMVAISAYTQNTQAITGTVIDQVSEEPLIGATVECLLLEQSIGSITDENGYFRLNDVPIGRQSLRISYLGYEQQTIPNIVVNAGKTMILDIQLEESIARLDEVVITAEFDKSKTVNELATVSARQFSVEEIIRYSGGRSDVARLAANFAGVSTSNDARNDIVIRGNSPTGVLWRLEGIPIPNPNHFATLGTTGGPVSALNPNLLKNSDFLTSAFPAEYGNVSAGVFDLGFRSGNRDEHEFMLQVGAVSGFEFMAEGPMGKAGGSSYLVSGRYSFIGIAGDLGLNIGTNASPQYQDIAFKLDFKNSKAGKFTLFGIGGNSNIDFLHSEIDEGDLFALEDEDAFAESLFGVVGLKHNLFLGKEAYLRTVIALSTSQNTFRQDRIFDLGTQEESALPYTVVDNAEFRNSLSTFINKKFNARFSGRAGILVERFSYNIDLAERDMRPDLDGDGFPDLTTAYRFDESAMLIQAYAQGQYKVNKSWTLNAGVHAQRLGLNKTSALEPRAAINFHIDDNKTVTLGYGLHHQTQPLPVLLLREPISSGEFIESNRNLDFTQNRHIVLAYDWQFAKDWRLKIEAYDQKLSDVPVEPFASSYSILNSGADFAFDTDVFGLKNSGSGTNQGLEFTLEKFFSNGYYGLMTASFYESKYKGSDGIERHTAFNNTYVFNVLAGREFKIGRNGRNALTLDTKFTTAGGRRFTPVNLEASAQAGFEIREEDNAYSQRYDPYLRLDLKFGFRRNSRTKKIAHHFFMDFQNLTNKENIFITRYNRIDNAVVPVNQIGFIPDFMYRIQF